MRSDLLSRALAATALVYTLTAGGTYNGLTDPRFRFVSLIGLILLVSVWLLVRWRGRWTWYHTPLDAAVGLWIFAFGLSLAANQDAWRRIAIGLWYMGLYAGLWYMLLDVMANRRLSRAGLIEALLVAGLVVLVFGYIQIVTSLIATGSLPRVVSTLGNPNTLAAVLVVLLPLALARAAGALTRSARLWYALYALAAGVLLAVSRSRGAWIGAGAGLAVLSVLLLAHFDLLSLSRLRSSWRRLTRPAQLMLAAGAMAVLIVAAGALVYAFSALNQPGRDLEARTDLWQVALAMGTEKPLTGQGLFTFGRHLPRYDSIPPNPPHAQAHNAPLQVFGELGLVGVVTMVVSLGLVLRAAQRNWTQSSGPARILVAGAGSAVVAFAAHHLTDLPALMPAVALAGLVALVALTAPVNPTPLRSRFRRWGGALALLVLWIALLVTGLWASTVYNEYLDALRNETYEDDPRAAAARLDTFIAAEPDLSLYRGQQAYLLGLAAHAGDRNAAAEAAEGFARAAALEPYFAPYHANQAVLLWNSGQLEDGLAAMERAAELAPDAWQLQYTLGLYAEALGKSDVAAAAYDRALTANPDADLYPAWGATELQAARRSRFEDRAPLVQTALLLAGGQVGDALALWETDLSSTATPAALVVRALMELATGDRDAAASWLAQAGDIAAEDDPWLLLGEAYLARFSGEANQATELAARADSAIRLRVPAGSEAYAQYHRLGIEPYFLPQVYYPAADPAFVYLLNRVRPLLGNRSS